MGENMKYFIIIIILLIIIGCSTIPQEYKVEPYESEIMYIEIGMIYGVLYTFVIGSSAYWYLENIY